HIIVIYLIGGDSTMSNYNYRKNYSNNKNSSSSASSQSSNSQSSNSQSQRDLAEQGYVKKKGCNCNKNK
ncbi:hypothetical protein, partial [Bacillus toyonensis]